jgi:hypothetical protein
MLPARFFIDLMAVPNLIALLLLSTAHAVAFTTTCTFSFCG